MCNLINHFLLITKPSDRPQIYDIKAINKIQENLVEALKVQISRNHSSDTQTFQKLMQKINELRALGSSHSLHLQWFRSNWLRLKLPPLFRYVHHRPSHSISHLLTGIVFPLRSEINDIPRSGNAFVEPSSSASQPQQPCDQQTASAPVPSASAI